MLGPKLFIFFLGRTACFCVKKIQKFFLFQGGEDLGWRSVVSLFIANILAGLIFLSLNLKIKFLKEYFLVLSLFIVWLSL